jgi:hypothetical protein
MTDDNREELAKALMNSGELVVKFLNKKFGGNRQMILMAMEPNEPHAAIVAVNINPSQVGMHLMAGGLQTLKAQAGQGDDE